MENQQNITLKPLQDEDILLFEKWLKQEYIYKWFCRDGDDSTDNTIAEEGLQDWLTQVKGRHTTHQHCHHFIVDLNGEKIGFCLYFDLFHEQDYLREMYPDLVETLQENHTYELGYLIGNPDYLGQGIGRMIIKKLEEQVGKLGGSRVIADPNEKNIPSIKVLLANGFTKFKDCDYRKNI